MAIDFLDILMEAKSKKPIKISATDDDQTDYTEDETSEEDTDEDTDEDEETSDDTEELDMDDEQPTDYTDSGEEDEGEEETDDGETHEDTPEDDEPTDYTDSEEEVGDDYPTDYTDDPDSDDGSDEMSEEPSENMTEEEEEGPTDDERKNKSLLEDLIRLKEIVGNFIDKTSTINGNDISNVKITNQLTNNLSQLSKQIHNYIVYRFSKETYVRNLYFYNYSVEALNISINMLKKINSFKHNK